MTQQYLPGGAGFGQDSLFTLEAHSGPIPPAHDFAAYERALPGAGREILDMAVREQAHRHAMESREVVHVQSLQRDGQQMGGRIAERGQTFGLAAVISVLLFGGGLAAAGSTTAGAIVAGVDIAAVAAVFVTGRWPARTTPGREVEPTGGEAPPHTAGDGGAGT